jgi:hypothetical protein
VDGLRSYLDARATPEECLSLPGIETRSLGQLTLYTSLNESRPLVTTRTTVWNIEICVLHLWAGFGKLFSKVKRGVIEHINATQTVLFKTSRINIWEEKRSGKMPVNIFGEKMSFFLQDNICIHGSRCASPCPRINVVTLVAQCVQKTHHSIKYYKFRKAIKMDDSRIHVTSKWDIWLQSVEIFSGNKTMSTETIFHCFVHIFFYLSMQKYLHGHANRAVTNKTTSKLVSRGKRGCNKGCVERESEREERLCLCIPLAMCPYRDVIASSALKGSCTFEMKLSRYCS